MTGLLMEHVSYKKTVTEMDISMLAVCLLANIAGGIVGTYLFSYILDKYL